MGPNLYDSLSGGEDGGSDFNAYAEEMLSKCRQLAREKKLERRLHRNDAQWRVEQQTSQTFEEDQIKTMPMMPSEEVMSAAPEKVHNTDLGLGEMPTFEHFPLRKISKRSVFQVTDLQQSSIQRAEPHFVEKSSLCPSLVDIAFEMVLKSGGN